MTSYQAQKLRITSPRCLIFSKDKPYNAAVKRDSLALCHLKFKYTVYDYTKVLVKNRKSLIFGHFAPFLKILTTVCSLSQPRNQIETEFLSTIVVGVEKLFSQKYPKLFVNKTLYRNII